MTKQIWNHKLKLEWNR